MRQVRIKLLVPNRLENAACVVGRRVARDAPQVADLVQQATLYHGLDACIQTRMQSLSLTPHPQHQPARRLTTPLLPIFLVLSTEPGRLRNTCVAQDSQAPVPFAVIAMVPTLSTRQVQVRQQRPQIPRRWRGFGVVAEGVPQGSQVGRQGGDAGVYVALVVRRRDLRNETPRKE